MRGGATGGVEFGGAVSDVPVGGGGVKSGAAEEGVVVVVAAVGGAGFVGSPGPDGGVGVVLVGEVIGVGAGVEEGCVEGWGYTTVCERGC